MNVDKALEHLKRFDRKERGLKYLNNKSWAEVSREERYFCAHLYHLVQTHGIMSFIQYLNRSPHNVGLDENANWELAYEACFYRDVWQLKGKEYPLYSPKRTFDLCLLSDNAIVVIEAKAYQEFDIDQLNVFEKDKTQLKKETEVDVVLLAGLASSKYKAPDKVTEFFNGPYLTWSELSALYNNDKILLRADDIYEMSGSLTYGKNNISGSMTGNELAIAYASGEEFIAGRVGGLTGTAIIDDITSASWKTRKYETNREAKDTVNSNWFWLSEFMKMLGVQR